MAEFVNSIGQVRGKFGNVVAYVRANGKNYCKGASISRKPSTESQKQQAAAFAVVVSRKGLFETSRGGGCACQPGSCLQGGGREPEGASLAPRNGCGGYRLFLG